LEEFDTEAPENSLFDRDFAGAKQAWEEAKAASAKK